MGRTVNQPKPRTITPSFASIRRTSRQRAIDLAGSVLAKPDQFLSAQELEEPRQRFSRMSLTALYDDYHAAWTPYKMEHGGKQAAQSGVHSGTGAGVEAVEEGVVSS
jgi:hypothetical protein